MESTLPGSHGSVCHLPNSGTRRFPSGTSLISTLPSASSFEEEISLSCAGNIDPSALRPCISSREMPRIFRLGSGDGPPKLFLVESRPLSWMLSGAARFLTVRSTNFTGFPTSDFRTTCVVAIQSTCQGRCANHVAWRKKKQYECFKTHPGKLSEPGTLRKHFVKMFSEEVWFATMESNWLNW